MAVPREVAQLQAKVLPMAVEISAPSVPIVRGRTTAPDAPVPLQVAAGLLRGLNREQRAAVKHGDGPLLVLAGPGTGKTEVVTRRLAWLIATKRARPREILALTFTQNAAEEMQARVDVLVPYGQADAEIHTFHAFGDALLREFAFELGLPGDVRLINRSEQIVLLRENLFQLGLAHYRPLGDPTRFLGALVDVFQRAKDEDVPPDALSRYMDRLALDSSMDPQEVRRGMELASAYARYQALLAERGLIDHGDQITLPLGLLRDHPSVRAEVRARYQYLLVDEFQDMNQAQVALVDQLAESGGNVTVVGDPNQAIYTFRGAGRDNMVAFHERHTDPKRILLRRNYRSRRPIIDAAHRLMANGEAGQGAIERQVAHRRVSGSTQPVRVVAYRTPEQEADGVAAAITDAIAAGARPRDFCVLARSNHEVEPLALALRVRGVPVRTHLPSDFFAHPQVRPLLAYLRVVADPSQTLELYALCTSFPYSLGGEQLTALLGLARRSHRSLWDVLQESRGNPDLTGDLGRSLARMVADVEAGIALSHQRSSTEVLFDHVKRTGRLARLAEAVDPAEPRTVARFFEIVRGRARLLAHDRVGTLVPHLDTLIEAEDELADTGPLDLDAVSVLTAHRAKGLEFKFVYVAGLADGRFPARGRPPAISLPWDEIRGAATVPADRLAEERRLCFVAMTRARDELWLTHHLSAADGRRRRPSPFIAAALDAPSPTAAADVDAIAQIGTFAQPAATPVAQPARDAARTVFSFSELEGYLDCPERYRLRHVVGLPTAPHHALTYGSALHQAVAGFHLAQKQGRTMSEDELLGVFAAAWSSEGFLSREHEEVRYAAGRDALHRFREMQLRASSNVVAIERPFAFQLDELTIRGRMDRVDRTDEGAVIVDYKSSDVRDQTKADQKARDSLQLQVYAMAHEAETRLLPDAVQLHFLDSGIVGTARPEPARLERARATLRAAAAGITAADFKPRPSPMTCGYCPFRQICPSSAA